ncbi:MAG: PilZ domain-containing protein [Hyphomicrobiales bacterium]|uniref:PilZ domain-containing protein n=1 Tax=Aestuariivirga sp. TaxID=2650926 RepID=UPI0035B21FE5
MQFGKRAAPAPSAAPMPQGFAARLLLAGGRELHCEVTAVDPDSALFLLSERPPEGTPLIAYIDEVGRVDGNVGEADDRGFWVNFSLTGGRQTRFARHLRWLIRRDRGQAAAERRHTRFEAAGKKVHFSLPGGREQPCELIDISLSGAGLRSPVRPSVGSPVAVGRMKARVVRHFEDGFAVEFLTPLDRSDLDSALG